MGPYGETGPHNISVYQICARSLARLAARPIARSLARPLVRLPARPLARSLAHATTKPPAPGPQSARSTEALAETCRPWPTSDSAIKTHDHDITSHLRRGNCVSQHPRANSSGTCGLPISRSSHICTSRPISRLECADTHHTRSSWSSPPRQTSCKPARPLSRGHLLSPKRWEQNQTDQPVPHTKNKHM